MALASGEASRGEVGRLFIISTTVVSVVALYNGILAPALIFLMPLAMIALIFRLARLRIVLIGLVAAVLVWPLVFERGIKSGLRLARPPLRSQEHPEERLNLSRQLALLDEYGRQDVEAPSLMTMVRMALSRVRSIVAASLWRSDFPSIAHTVAAAHRRKVLRCLGTSICSRIGSGS